jgi:lysophospholipase L1-like esterase
MFLRCITFCALVFIDITRAEDTNGVILLHASTAIVHGKNLRYEPQTNKNTLGYWTLPADWAEWKFAVDRPGVFEVEILQGCGKGNGGSDVNVEAAGQSLPFVVEDTGHFQNFTPRKIGRVHFWKAGEFSLAIKPQNKKAGAVMDCRQVRLIKIPFETEDATLLARIAASRRVVFLGDSITYSGQYVEEVEAALRKYSGFEADFINLALPSETLSGLSEGGHAGGAFPRPNLHERLDRILEKAKPDLIFACYGMNDGIYLAFNEERFEKFKQGSLLLHEKAKAAGCQVIQLTPPVFDPGAFVGPGKRRAPEMYGRYNEVLDLYSAWLWARRDNDFLVIDIHSPLNLYVEARRAVNQSFILAPDAVHLGEEGHNVIARELLENITQMTPGTRLFDLSGALKTNLVKFDSPREAENLKLVQQRQRLRKDAWLTYIGHQRPGMNHGKPLDEAEAEADALAAKIVLLQDPDAAAKIKP